MRSRYPLPTLWLMTDPRIADLRAAISRLPKGQGIVFRHYALPAKKRRALFKQVQTWAKAKRHLLLLADHPLKAMQWGADGAHDRSLQRSRGIRTVAVHTAHEAVIARRVRADLIFVSPVFETRSHASARLTGRIGLARLAGAKRSQTIALGGMTAKRAKLLRPMRLGGWAAIDAFA